MTSLQKFKLLAMQCGASQSPTRSPVVHLRRRKTTLRMLLRRAPRRREPPLQRERLLGSPGKKGGDLVRRHSLKDLFGSSPPGKKEEEEENKVPNAANTGLGGSGFGPGSPRPCWTSFRYRSLLSRKASWRPVLLTIDE